MKSGRRNGNERGTKDRTNGKLKKQKLNGIRIRGKGMIEVEREGERWRNKKTIRERERG